MTKLYLSLMNRVNRDEQGQGLVEYALIIALVSVLLVAALTTLQGGIDKVFTGIAGTLTGV
ncbi:MAG TPA: Flp family type IVb pilin [Chloroflexota bacterium]|jgi:pilus assembly protein Flp/PilA|nr:Flp family type IVb pilin [Chloroflexota bacterium]